MVKVSIDCNQPLPSCITNKPVLPFYLTIFWEAFCLLNSCRSYNQLPQPLSLNEIKSYFDIYGKIDDCEAFIEYIKHLDQLFLNKISKGK